MTRKALIAEILCTGEELLLGDIVNTNAAFLSAELTALGICVYHHSVVGDDPKRLGDCVSEALSRSDIVIVSGGLGPTKDDLTKETVAKLFGREMELHVESLEAIKDYFENNSTGGAEDEALKEKLDAVANILGMDSSAWFN